VSRLGDFYCDQLVAQLTAEWPQARWSVDYHPTTGRFSLAARVGEEIIQVDVRGDELLLRTTADLAAVVRAARGGK